MALIFKEFSKLDELDVKSVTTFGPTAFGSSNDAMVVNVSIVFKEEARPTPMYSTRYLFLIEATLVR